MSINAMQIVNSDHPEDKEEQARKVGKLSRDRQCERAEKLAAMSDAMKSDLFQIHHRASDYTWPTEALIHTIAIDERYLHVELVDGRNLSIPLWWIPTLHEADMEDLALYEISRDRTLILWDPVDTAGRLNEILRITDYLGPSTRERKLEAAQLEQD